jgi:group I intron endonuclease
VYVGVTNNYTKRMREHKGTYNNYLISKAIKKHGWNNFNSQILLETEDAEYAYRVAESSFIQQYQSNNPKKGYNLTEGGQGTLGFSPTTESRQKMREKKLGKKLTPEHIQKISQSALGRTFTKETKTKISIKLKGNKNFQGKTFTNEIKQILSEHKAKDWQLLSPNGKIINIHNMRKFCIDNNLHHSAITRVLQGKQSHHKQWKKV